MPGVAAGRHQADWYRGAPIIAMQENEFETSDAGTTRVEIALELEQQALRDEQQGFGVAYLGGQFLTSMESQWRLEIRSRFRQMPQRAIESVKQILPATPRQPVARQFPDLAERANAAPA